MNYSCGWHKTHCLQVNGKYIIILIVLSHKWGISILILWGKQVHIEREDGKRRSEMASSKPATLHRYTLFNRRHKWAALHSRALQCKQLGLHSTSHLLAVAPTNIFINSCVYQNLVAYVAIFLLIMLRECSSLAWWKQSWIPWKPRKHFFLSCFFSDAMQRKWKMAYLAWCFLHLVLKMLQAIVGLIKIP